MSTEQQARSIALLEELRSHLKVVAEGHGALAERIYDTDARLAQLERRFDELEIRVVRAAQQPRRFGAKRAPTSASRTDRGATRGAASALPGGPARRRSAP